MTGKAIVVAKKLMEDYFQGRISEKQTIKELFDIATHKDESLAKSGVDAIFKTIVEPLNDSFDAHDRNVYYEIFSYLIQLTRKLPEAKHIDEKLEAFGLLTHQDLLNRVKGLIVSDKTSHIQRHNVKKVFVLSRVTIGADVAITSIIIERSKRLFPKAQIIFLANKKNYELFGEDKNIRILPQDYKKRGGLIPRLESWLEALENINRETKHMGPCENVIIDTNSRITQLGLLPLVKDDTGYFLFEPIVHTGEDTNKLGEDVNEWLDKKFGVIEKGPIYPTLNIPLKYNKAAKEFLHKLSISNKFIVTINFGVGGNDDKRISDRFEFEIVLHLIEKGARVILDEGFGKSETERTDRIINQLREHGKTIMKVNENLSFTTGTAPDLITYKGGIGQFAALISLGRSYLGYDSMGQHVAAALGIPELVIFNGYPTEKFSRKWHPYGNGKIKIIDANGKTENDVLKSVKSELRVLL